MELSSKVDSLSQESEGYKKMFKEVLEKLNSLEHGFQSMSALVKEKSKDGERSIGQNSFSDSRHEDSRQSGSAKGVKLDVTDFNGDSNPKVFLDWLHSLESYFKWHQLAEERKISFAEAKLKGTTRVWWEKYQQTHFAVTRTWEDIKMTLTRFFVPPNYKQRVHLQFVELVQGSLSVEEYTNKFLSLAAKSDFPWNEDIMISMYRKGLNPHISSGLAASRIYTMNDAVQIAYQMEEEYKKKSSMSISNKGKTLDKSSGGFTSTTSDSDEKTHGGSSSSNQLVSSTLKSAQKAAGFGHLMGQCPNRLVAFADKEDPIASANPEQKANEVVELQAEQEMELCTLVIDGGSCSNVIFEEAVLKLGLPTEPHPSPYKVAWVNNTNLKVNDRCLVTYTIGKLVDSVTCDVLPMKVCHILLGRPWLYDKKVQHCGYNNTYSFKDGSSDFKFVPTKGLSTIKLKKTAGTFLLKQTESDDSILGPIPNSTESSSFQRGRINAAAMTWLEKNYPLWKPKIKPTPFWSKGKSPWLVLWFLSPLTFLALFLPSTAKNPLFLLKSFCFLILSTLPNHPNHTLTYCCSLLHQEVSLIDLRDGISEYTAATTLMSTDPCAIDAFLVSTHFIS
ncbi:putative retrotransposon gag domain-containing protein [Rosa chinensis]|uniref:Putative retrotransposon gag domain-containing protein n=1 Tax=Rosa chinensis TaxID=74649 RepID=A0A2P6S9A2_ROSCH|nr:putative retrotransposon gag domain-containing protein [Rosa chinensis]